MSEQPEFSLGLPPLPHYRQRDGIDRRGQRNPQPKGYPRRPGSGPKDERCNTCAHYWVSANGRFRKCELLRHCWTNSYGTDIRAKSPACELWEKPHAEILPEPEKAEAQAKNTGTAPA